MATLTVKENTMIISYEENGVSINRDATAEEIAYIKSAQADAAESKKTELNQKLTTDQKLASVGLSVDDLKAALGL